MAGPLTDIRVLDLSRVLAGPWCTQMLADMGAEVIKIERPGTGDDTRHWGPPWHVDAEGTESEEAAYFLSANRGKHSVTIDISTSVGQQLVKDLAAKSDIVVENFKTGDLAGKGLAYEDLAAVHSGLIYCSITGFGQTGPMAHDVGYDYMIQGMGGLMSITGIPDGEPGAGPQRVGVAVSDLTAGMHAAAGILAALYHRQRTGEGQHLDISLLDVQVSWLANQALNYFTSGEVPGRTGANHPNLSPYQPFPTKDGHIIIAVGNDDQFRRLCEAVGCRQLATDPRFATNSGRVENRVPLAAALTAVIQEKNTGDWLDTLRAVSVPCGPINSIDEVFENPQVRHRGMKIDLPHAAGGTVPGLASPLRFSSTSIEYSKSPPLLGEDTEATLIRLLGKTPEQIAALRSNGTI